MSDQVGNENVCFFMMRLNLLFELYKITCSTRTQSTRMYNILTEFMPIRERPFDFKGGGGAGRLYWSWKFFSTETESCLFVLSAVSSWIFFSRHWVKHGMEWNGMEWNGMDWNGMEWNGLEWNGMEWIGMEWNGMEFYQEHFLFISNLPPLNLIVPLTLTPRPPNHDPLPCLPDLDPQPTPTLTNNLDPSSALDPKP